MRKVIHTYRVYLRMGQVTHRGDKLICLTEKELDEFNTVGLTGRLNRHPMTQQQYLNSLGKGHFVIESLEKDVTIGTEELLIVFVPNKKPASS